MRGSATRDAKRADLKTITRIRFIRRKYRQKIDAQIPNWNCRSTTGRIEIGKLGRVTVILILVRGGLAEQKDRRD